MDGAVAPTSAQRGLSLILPAYNEEASIEQAVSEADAALAQLVDDYEILVIDDGSRDHTAEIVTALTARFAKLRLIAHQRNEGYGAALRTGFEAARFDRIAYVDADCQFDLRDLSALLARVEQCPIAVGHRVDRKDARLRRIASWGYNVLARSLLGIRARDCDCALKVFRREALDEILPTSKGFFVSTEMLTSARQKGLEVGEIGVSHRRRAGGRSTVSWREVPRTLSTLLPFWWTRVLFPTSEKPRSAPTRIAWGLPLVLFVAIALFLTQLSVPLLEPQEARYAEIPREMLDKGSWLTPVLHGQPYLDKPPLLYWTTMMSFRIFGATDWAARLVPGLAGVLIVCVTFWWGRRAVGDRTALAGALMLCLSVRFIYLGRMLSFDVLLALFVLIGLACAHVSVSRRRLHLGWWTLAGIAGGLGIMSKGPVALLLIAPPVWLLGRLDPRLARPRTLHWALFGAVALTIAAPWHVWISLKQPGFAYEYLWRHHVLRFLAPFDHPEPIWFFVPSILLGMLPWTLLLPGMLRFLGRHSRGVVSRRPAALGFFLLSFLWGFLFFSLSGGKRAVYVLPVLPMLALSLGCYLDCILPRRLAGARAFFQPLPATLLARYATLTVLWLTLLGAAAGVLIEMIPPMPGLILITAPVLGLLLLTRRSATRLSWSACAATTFTMLFIGVQWGLPDYNRRFALKHCVNEHRDAVSDREVPLACYPQAFSSVSFYSKRDDVQVYSAAQKNELIAAALRHGKVLLFVKSGRSLEDLRRSLPVTLELRPLSHRDARQGKVVVGWLMRRDERRAGQVVQRE